MNIRLLPHFNSIIKKNPFFPRYCAMPRSVSVKVLSPYVHFFLIFFSLKAANFSTCSFASKARPFDSEFLLSNEKNLLSRLSRIVMEFF